MNPGPMNPDQRAAYRAFVRQHHPDRGGDPAVFVAGLARFHGAGEFHGTGGPGPARDERRFDAPVEVVGTLPFPVRVGVALIRTWHRHQQRRVR